MRWPKARLREPNPTVSPASWLGQAHFLAEEMASAEGALFCLGSNAPEGCLARPHGLAESHVLASGRQCLNGQLALPGRGQQSALQVWGLPEPSGSGVKKQAPNSKSNLGVPQQKAGAAGGVTGVRLRLFPNITPCQGPGSMSACWAHQGQKQGQGFLKGGRGDIQRATAFPIASLGCRAELPGELGPRLLSHPADSLSPPQSSPSSPSELSSFRTIDHSRAPELCTLHSPLERPAPSPAFPPPNPPGSSCSPFRTHFPSPGRLCLLPSGERLLPTPLSPPTMSHI